MEPFSPLIRHVFLMPVPFEWIQLSELIFIEPFFCFSLLFFSFWQRIVGAELEGLDIEFDLFSVRLEDSVCCFKPPTLYWNIKEMVFGESFGRTYCD